LKNKKCLVAIFGIRNSGLVIYNFLKKWPERILIAPAIFLFRVAYFSKSEIVYLKSEILLVFADNQFKSFTMNSNDLNFWIIF